MGGKNYMESKFDKTVVSFFLLKFWVNSGSILQESYSFIYASVCSIATAATAKDIAALRATRKTKYSSSFKDF